MSYDILLVPRRPGQGLDEALDDATGGPLDAARLAQWARVEARLRQLLGDVLVHVDAAGGVAELSHPPTGLQVELFADQGAVSYPYWEHEDRAAFHRLVTAVVATVTGDTGLEAYDPQTDGPFTGEPDDHVGVSGTTTVITERGGAPFHVPAADVPPVPDAALAGWRPAPGRTRPERRPLTDGDQRSRALRYLVCGAILLVLSGGRVLTGTVTAWGVVLTCAGAAYVVIGTVIWRRWVAPRR